MSCKIEFDFSLNQQVTILTTKLKGTIKGMSLDDRSNKNYWVEYADRNGAIFSRYFLNTDIKAVATKK